MRPPYKQPDTLVTCPACLPCPITDADPSCACCAGRGMVTFDRAHAYKAQRAPSSPPPEAA